jgi:hypothetical protein
MGILIALTPVEMAIDGLLRFFPDAQESIRGVQLFFQGNIIIIHGRPRVPGIKWLTLPSGQEDVGLECVFKKAVRASANLKNVGYFASL